MRRRAAGGFAFVMTVFVVLIAGSLVASVTLLGSTHVLVEGHYERRSELGWAADGALEWARSELNAKPWLYPTDGYVTLESGVPVFDADGRAIPEARRWTYAGRHREGVGSRPEDGSIVTVVRERGGGAVVRRLVVFPGEDGRLARGEYRRVESGDIDLERLYRP